MPMLTLFLYLFLGLIACVSVWVLLAPLFRQGKKSAFFVFATVMLLGSAGVYMHLGSAPLLDTITNQQKGRAALLKILSGEQPMPEQLKQLPAIQE